MSTSKSKEFEKKNYHYYCNCNPVIDLNNVQSTLPMVFTHNQLLFWPICFKKSFKDFCVKKKIDPPKKKIKLKK